MTQPRDKPTVDAYKAIIEFNKTIITIASSVLTILVIYSIYQSIDLRILNYISITLIVLAVFFAFFAFGGSIQTVKDGISRKGTILHTNLSVFFLIGGIVLVLFTFNDKEEKSIDQILIKIEESTKTLNQQLSPKIMKSLEYKNEKYTIIYETDSTEYTVVYATKTDNIITIK